MYYDNDYFIVKKLNLSCSSSGVMVKPSFLVASCLTITLRILQYQLLDN
jgi:hypothetical protein